MSKRIEMFEFCSQMRRKYFIQDMFNALTDAMVFAGQFFKDYFKGLLNFPANGFASLKCIVKF